MRLRSTAYTKNQAEVYDEKRFVTKRDILFHQMELEHLWYGLLGTSVDSMVLEVGCGTGRFTKILAESGYAVTSVDPSPAMLEKAREKCADISNVRFIECWGDDLPFADGTFDVVYSIRVLNQTESKPKALSIVREMARVVANGGRLIIEYVNSERIAKIPSKAVRLSRTQVHQVVCEIDGFSEIGYKGILFGSMTLMNAAPECVYEPWRSIDAALSMLMPSMCSRCYLYYRKS